MRNALLALLLCATDARAAEVRIFAAASLTDVLGALGSLWSKANPDVRMVFQFGASSDLARQIRAGAPAYLFFSADERLVNALEREGLVEPGSRRDVISNTLVLIAPRQGSVASPADLTGPGVRRIALADPGAVPAGVYCREYFERAGIWRAIEPKVVPTLDVRAAAAAVASGHVDAGCVYKTDVTERVRVVFEVPRSEGPRIVYPLVAVKGRLTPEARQVLDSLVSAEAYREYERAGFVRP